MAGLIQAGSGIAGLFGGTSPAFNITNPFTPFPVTNPFQDFQNPFANFQNPFDLNALLNMGLSPTQTAATNFFGGQQDARTRDIYARLGLGGSTMQGQDLGANELARLAEEQQFIEKNQQLGLSTQQGTLSAEQIAAQGTLSAEQIAAGGTLSAEQLAAQTQQNFQQGTLNAEIAAANASNQAFQQGQSNLKNIVGGLNTTFGGAATGAGTSGGGGG
jgi:hypothetical protein